MDAEVLARSHGVHATTGKKAMVFLQQAWLGENGKVVVESSNFCQLALLDRKRATLLHFWFCDWQRALRCGWLRPFARCLAEGVTLCCERIHLVCQKNCFVCCGRRQLVLRKDSSCVAEELPCVAEGFFLCLGRILLVSGKDSSCVWEEDKSDLRLMGQCSVGPRAYLSRQYA